MIDEDKLNALELFGENEYLHKEIERLNKELELYKDNHEHLNNLLQQKDNIIKEVREYADKMLESYDSKGLLEILDKENK